MLYVFGKVHGAINKNWRWHSAVSAV